MEGMGERSQTEWVGNTKKEQNNSQASDYLAYSSSLTYSMLRIS